MRRPVPSRNTHHHQPPNNHPAPRTTHHPTITHLPPTLHCPPPTAHRPPKVTSANGWPHSVRAELDGTSTLRVWVDGRPLPPVALGPVGVHGYLGLATYNLLGNDLARVVNVTVTAVLAPAGFPAFECNNVGPGTVVTATSFFVW